MNDVSSKRRQLLDAVPLWPHLAVLGLVGGWICGNSFREGDLDGILALLVIITPVVAALLGHVLTRKLSSDWLWMGLTVIGFTCVAGLVNGAAVGSFAAGSLGFVVGIIFGTFCSVPFMPAIFAVALAARPAYGVRPGSVVGSAIRRSTWVVTLVMSVLPVALVHAWDPSQPPALVVLGVALVGMLGINFLDAIAQRRLVRLRNEPTTPRENLDAEAVSKGAFQVDLGVGDGFLCATKAARGSVYRGRETVATVVRGCPDLALRAISRRLAIHAALTVAAALYFAFCVHQFLEVDLKARNCGPSQLWSKCDTRYRGVSYRDARYRHFRDHW